MKIGRYGFQIPFLDVPTGVFLPTDTLNPVNKIATVEKTFLRLLITAGNGIGKLSIAYQVLTII
jgi:hypothetical protein